MAVMYKGFSTDNRYKKFRVTDLELVKQNLNNHFSIRKGEKLMQPNFGSIIWNILFEPLTSEIKDVIVDDIKQVVAYDPRTQVTNVIVTEFEHGIQIEIELFYIPTNQSSIVSFNFDNNSQTLTSSG